MQNHQLDTSIGPLEGISHALQLLHPIQNNQRPFRHELLVHIFHIQIQFLDLSQNVLPPAQFANEHAQLIPHLRRIDVLVGIGTALERRYVKPALVREGRCTNIGRCLIRCAVERLVQESTEGGYPLQVIFACHILTIAMQCQRGNDGAEVGISGAFADAVDGSLDETDAGLDGSEGIGHGESAVVMAVDAKGGGWEVGERCFCDLFDFPWHDPPIGITHDQNLRPPLHSRLTTLQRIPLIKFIPIEEMFQIDHNLPSPLDQIPHAIPYHLQVLLRIGPQNVGHLPQMRLGHDAHGGRTALDQHSNLRIVLGVDVLATRAAERYQLAPRHLVQFQLRPSKKFFVLGIGSRPSRLDVIDVEFR
mmetsp:Transcript_23253/g.49096  ORF Transcript_23253/g.49096 Transcript_23253/m.49096 type:complete len:362 (+) Transcript_23253:303-1388(+)